ncbi:MAG: MoaD/ThiS family protein [Nitrososphaerota archaeon]|nr:MoaD/ThiS family protein [Nitrososphaerota archaeon]MDG7021021.1 MoaD/ThiS family protein [Nitrososphaerota archaeon]
MIHVRFLGHIKSSMGADEREVPAMTVGELFSALLSEEPSGPAHGFTKYNTLVVVNDQEAFSASSEEARSLRDGDTVLLVPFSHGG